MASRTLVVLLLASCTAHRNDQTRWSRQISSGSEYTDWVPLPGPGPVERALPSPAERALPPIKRQAVAEPRILSEPVFPGFTRPTGFSQEFNRNFFGQPTNRQLYLQSVPAVPSAPQNYLTDQGFSQGNQFLQNIPSQQFGQGIRFGLTQPNFPLNQGFVGPQFTFDANPNKLRQSVVNNPIRFDNVQQVPMSPQAKPFNSLSQKKIEAPKFVDGYRAENTSDFGVKNKKLSLQKMKFEVPRTEMMPPPNKAKSEKEEVQLLYVPLESLNRGSFNFRPVPSPHLLNTDHYSQTQPRPNPPKQSFASEYQKPATKLEGFGTEQDFFTNFNSYKDNTKNIVDQVPKYSTSSPFPTAAPTTPKPKKLKPHQPPLAIFMLQESKRGSLRVGDVLASLKNAPSVAVLDSVNPASAPKVFIGPSNLNPPENYVRFELPYLSNIEHSDKKIRQLPFFVAPLSYNTPNGFAKIPFPSPHVGSVVINSQIKETPTTVRERPSTIPTPAASVIPNSYSTSQKKTGSKLEQSNVTQKPTFSYYSTTAPKTNPPANYQSNYYAIEPQTVSTLRTPKEPQESYTPTTKQPSFVSRQPALEPRKPEFVARQPEYVERQPQYVARQPENVARQPENVPRKPEYVARQPENVPRKPEYVARQPSFAPRQPQHEPAPRQPIPPREPEKIRQQEPPRQQTAPRQPGSYYLRDQGQYNPSQVNYQDYKPQINAFNIARPETTSTARTTVSTTTAKPSTYPSQLLETHNPYSINQAFHFSTPLDYHNLFEEGYATPKVSPPPPPSISSAEPSSTVPPSTKTSSVVTEENYASPNYLQNYSPEIHYQSEIQSSRFPVYNNEYTTKPEVSSEYNPSVSTVNDNSESISVSNQETQGTIGTQTSNTENTRDQTQQTFEEATRSPNNQYETTNYESTKEEAQTTPSTTTTTRRSAIRNRGRPRYTTTPRSDSGETTSRTVTRRPLRERKPSPTRPRYESRATERTTKSDDSETTTKYSRGRVRGRPQKNNDNDENKKDSDSSVRGKTQYKSSASDDFYGKSNGGKYGNKEGDLAYQRDVLHQNYPVTIQERTSTKDIDAITEPSSRISSTRNLEPVTEVYDTENAYSYDRAAISHQVPNLNSKEVTYDSQTEANYSPGYSTTREEDYYQRSSPAPVETVSSFVETSKNDKDIYSRQTTAAPKETVSFVTDPPSTATESVSNYASNNDYSTKTEETSATPELDTRIASKEEEEENIVQTTPSYNRIRVRPGVVRQYHQSTSTESPKIKTERRRPSQAVTYRPAFNQRRTTMRIEEIEQDLKTKQVRLRPDVQEINRHPVYRPEPTTEPAVTTQTTNEATKRTVFRRRRPSYTTTTTEGSTSAEGSTKKPTFEVKSRFRGRQPSTKTTEKSEEVTTTVKNHLHSRYSNRPRLSERFNKKSQEDQEDQETNYSFNRPKYVEPEGDNTWSPKISTDSFKPYNPNDIVDDNKPTTERRSDVAIEDIITARNEYDDILLTVTPATNNKQGKNSDINPTLEALVEQGKTTKSDGESMSTFETMLVEVMKSLEEQDENEYSTHVMKHKGGEIGEIPPESIITEEESEREDSERKTTVAEQSESQSENLDVITATPAADESTHEDVSSLKSRRRGFWKKVKVRPVTETIEAAESQYYANTVNRLGQTITLSKTVHDKNGLYDKPRIVVTTYKPSFQLIKDIVHADEDDLPFDDAIPVFDIPKINKTNKLENKTERFPVSEVQATETNAQKETSTEMYPEDKNVSEASDSTVMDVMYRSTMTESSPTPTATTSKPKREKDDENGSFSFMDYLFGYSANGNEQDDREDSDKTEPIQNQNDDEEPIVRNRDETQTEESKTIQTTESSYIPEEFTATNEDKLEKDVTSLEIKRVDATEKVFKDVSDLEKAINTETATTSSFMDPSNVMSTSMSTEVSHETEICFRGKCIKTNKDIML